MYVTQVRSITLDNLINALPYTERREIWLDLQNRLTSLFIQPYYSTSTYFFNEYAKLVSECSDYIEAQIDSWADDNQVTDTSLIKQQLLYDPNPKRFKLCNQCKAPFIDFTTRNNNRYCSKQVFKSYAMSSKRYTNKSFTKSVCAEKAKQLRS